jgi:hypothetical protein
MTNRMQSPAEPGFARAQPSCASRLRGKKERAHGGTMGSPVFKIEEMEKSHA